MTYGIFVLATHKMTHISAFGLGMTVSQSVSTIYDAIFEIADAGRSACVIVHRMVMSEAGLATCKRVYHATPGLTDKRVAQVYAVLQGRPSNGRVIL
ncbi:hypothetical protein AWB76_07623 [Caballeronia temeraria]|uniref:Uncharacterized protein n=1 Tax=Caballeronia temeraria TaxID=1777137 RepID=A0A158DXQ4_9BURK|nr:hypothetical protein AWB76_07623 [Caballeronia temeraria]